jgi:hypothetical protein
MLQFFVASGFVGSSIMCRLRTGALVGALLLFGISHTACAEDLSTIGISGDPATAVDAGREYDFSPEAFIVSNLPSRFEIENLPLWATFDDLRGELTGSPGAADAGWYPNIRICLSDGVQRSCLTDFSITVNPEAATKRFARVSWNAPNTSEDGTELTDLVGYLIYSGPSPQALIPMVSLPNGNVTSYVFENLEAGEHFFAVTALSALGGESVLSDIISTQLH